VQVQIEARDSPAHVAPAPRARGVSEPAQHPASVTGGAPTQRCSEREDEPQPPREPEPRTGSGFRRGARDVALVFAATWIVLSGCTENIAHVDLQHVLFRWCRVAVDQPIRTSLAIALIVLGLAGRRRPRPPVWSAPAPLRRITRSPLVLRGRALPPETDRPSLAHESRDRLS
jgi:hypothetical protein